MNAHPPTGGGRGYDLRRPQPCAPPMVSKVDRCFGRGVRVTQVRIAEVDGLRALAMTMVVAQHCGLAPFGWTGVWLFFVISGYVISRNFLREEYKADSVARQFLTFMKRRFFRIVP